MIFLIYKILVGTILLLVFPGLKAQEWNPYVAQATMTPAPLIPAEFEGSGTFTFVVGNSGSHVMKRVENQEMTMMITLSLGFPAEEDPLRSIGGSWARKFSWSYDSQINTFTATQTEDIPAGSEGTVVIRYKVGANSPASAPANGCNVNLQQPPYTNGINLTHDDNLSAYTYVQAFDYGDAPGIYGVAVHEIDVSRDRGTGRYTNYVFLGASVDPEPASLHSPDADADDLNGKDDEDGVLFPELERGDTVTIPVKVTVHEGGYGVVYGWMDWNADGDFTDPGEKIAGPIDFFESGTKTLTLAIPAGAETSRPVYARFRIGENKPNPSGLNAWGEVEDYRVMVSTEKPEKESQHAPELLPSGPGKSGQHNFSSLADSEAGVLFSKRAALPRDGNKLAKPKITIEKNSRLSR